ncbi:glutamate receptor 1.1 [Corchorus olitorius]|uniref:Glutamate receptor 1.1 n=1 Tax=Corchorus olitorius TaxID=93759 RepID=A0A1R3KZL4_9ROSI|nr:glutamate receptor 1.1 [Corchorus olitorius]
MGNRESGRTLGLWGGVKSKRIRFCKSKRTKGMRRKEKRNLLCELLTIGNQLPGIVLSSY